MPALLDVSFNDVADDLVGVFRDPLLLTGIPLALLGAFFMSFGAQYQHRGVSKVERILGESGAGGLTARQFLHLLRRPSWIVGTVMLGLAIVCQLAALSVAPLIVVQPLGAISLVITTLLNAHITGHRPTGASIRAIIAAVGGIFVFVTIAAFVATEKPVTQLQLVVILISLAVVLLALGSVWWLWARKHGWPLFYIAASGVLYGFVATLAKVIIERLKATDIDVLTILCGVALLAAVGLGAYFVQTAYSVGPPDLVIAGLTVIDPIVAVLIGLIVLQEASTAGVGVLIGFAVAGALSIYGVISLARNHPQVVFDSQQVEIQRGARGDGPPPAAPGKGR